jgi:hypothetical protein
LPSGAVFLISSTAEEGMDCFVSPADPEEGSCVDDWGVSCGELGVGVGCITIFTFFI